MAHANYVYWELDDVDSTDDYLLRVLEMQKKNGTGLSQ